MDKLVSQIRKKRPKRKTAARLQGRAERKPRARPGPIIPGASSFAKPALVKA